MSLCPTTAAKAKTDYSAPGSLVLTPPDAKFEICEGGTTSVVTSPGTVVQSIVCCPSPGPAGPAGAAFILKYDGVELGTISSLDVKGTGLLPEIVGTEGILSTICMAWRGDWAAATVYKKNDVVRNATNGNGYVCMDNHTATVDDQPGETTGGDFYWEPMTDVNKAAITPENKTYLDMLQDVFDYVMNADTIGEWLTILAAGAGIVWAGAKIMEMYSGDGVGDGQAGSVYNGTSGYNGAFVAPTLPVVVASLMELGGYTSAQYDVSLLPNDQVNFTLNSTITIRTILQQLALVYQFDIVPSGEAVKFVPKYQSSVRTLTSDDLGHQLGDGLSGKAPYTAKRMQGIDLPRSVTITYNSGELDYNKFTQMSTLETYEEGQDVKLDVPLTLVDADAKRLSETALVNAHIEQQQYTFTTDYYNVDLEPGDVINIPLDSGGLTTVRIIQITEVDEGILEFTVVRADNNVTAYNVSPIPQTTPPDQVTNVPGTIGYSQSLFLEVPPLTTAETTPRLKVAVHGYAAPGWTGATLYKSTDGGVTYTAVAQSSSTPTIGLVATAPAAPSNYHVWDTTTTISVQLKQGTLSNSTDIAVQNGANWCMVGEEVIGFVNATLTGPNTYTLSRLMRGRQGSEVKCASHVNNELFVMLNDALLTLPFTTEEIGQTVKFKTVTNGSDISKATAEDVKPFALNLRPWAVAHLKAVRQVNNDWIISWVERPRYDNQLRDFTELTHDSDWAGFAIGIFNGAAVAHKAVSTAPTYTYTAAQQVTDFGAVQTTLNLSVSQISTITAGGYPTNITV